MKALGRGRGACDEMILWYVVVLVEWNYEVFRSEFCQKMYVYVHIHVCISVDLLTDSTAF